MQLIYDAKCSICRNLAQKIHLLSEQEVEIRALSDPRAQATLDGFYPDGWEHDFYVVDGDRCRRGARALPRLTGTLGARKMASVLAEYSYQKLAPSTCAAGNGVMRSKRNLLKAAAVSPVVFGLSKITPADPFRASIPGFKVHIAEVESLGGGRFRAHAYRCDECFREPKKLDPLAKGASAHVIDEAVLYGPDGEEAARGEARAGGDAMRIKRVRYEKSIPVNGGAETSVRTAFSLLSDHQRYGIAANFGRSDTATSFAGLVHHDLPITVVDWVVLKSDVEDAAGLFAAQAEGLEALARLHDRSARGEMADLYRQMAPNFLSFRRTFTDAVGEPLLTNTNELLITSMPEALRFIQLPEDLRALKADVDVAAACDCSCSCNVCCGCGCGLGICFTPFPCFCDCCISCGCGCGCCVF